MWASRRHSVTTHADIVDAAEWLSRGSEAPVWANYTGWRYFQSVR